MKDLSKFLKDCNEMGIILNESQQNQFLIYYDLLTEWNSYMNLTTIIEFEDVCKKHFTDSLSLIKAVPDINREEYRIIDIGTGAGFPGLPLKIAFPQLHITLLDSLQKRVKFLNEVIDKLGLEKIDTVHGRAEDYAKPDKLREKYDICVSRAVANLSTLTELCLPFVKVNGMFISYKSEKVAEESKTAEKAIELLGGSIYDQKEFLLPESEIYRNLFMIRKNNLTPKKYPRKAGLPAKEPLK